MNGVFLRMAHINRFSSMPLHHYETVAEHSFFVALYAYGIAIDLELSAQAKYLVLAKALVHDIDESITGDIIRPFKHSSAGLESAISKATDEKIQQALLDVSNGGYLYYIWRNAKDTTLEGSIVHLADYWSVVEYSKREWMLGNRWAELPLRDTMAALDNDYHSGRFQESLNPYIDALVVVIDKTLAERGDYGDYVQGKPTTDNIGERESRPDQGDL